MHEIEIGGCGLPSKVQMTQIASPVSAEELGYGFKHKGGV